MGEQSYKQLMMLRRAAPIPDIPMPVGWSVREMRENECAVWTGIMTGAGFFEGEPMDPEERWTRVMGRDPGIRTGNVFFACDEAGKPIAAAAARFISDAERERYPRSGNGLGYLHYVAALPECQGKGAGSAVTAAVLRRLSESGLGDCVLTTDDFRLPAIKSYLRMGWRPVLYAPDMRPRWEKVLGRLGYHEIDVMDGMGSPVTPVAPVLETLP